MLPTTRDIAPSSGSCSIHPSSSRSYLRTLHDGTFGSIDFADSGCNTSKSRRDQPCRRNFDGISPPANTANADRAPALFLRKLHCRQFLLRPGISAAALPFFPVCQFHGRHALLRSAASGSSSQTAQRHAAGMNHRNRKAPHINSNPSSKLPRALL